MMDTDLAGGGYRHLESNDLTGTMPTELGLMTAVTRLYVQRGTHPHPPAPWFTSQGAEVGRGDAMSQARVQQRGAVRRSRQRGQSRHVVHWPLGRLDRRHRRHRAGHRLPEPSAAISSSQSTAITQSVPSSAQPASAQSFASSSQSSTFS
jgi:hypothetical protein